VRISVLPNTGEQSCKAEPAAVAASLTQRVRSPWRERAFWIMLVRNRGMPHISVAQTIQHWYAITQMLTENARKKNICKYSSL